MLNVVPIEPGSPPQEEHDGVDSHDRDSEEDSGDDDDPVVAWVGHQDVSRNFCLESQEAIHTWEVGRMEAGRADYKMLCPTPNSHTPIVPGFYNLYGFPRSWWKVLEEFPIRPFPKAFLSSAYMILCSSDSKKLLLGKIIVYPFK